MRLPPIIRPLTRRELLARGGMGFGLLALGGMLGDGARADEGGTALAAKPPPLPAKAKRVIHLFMNGGPSHLDTFDPKPALARFAGKPLPSPLKTERPTGAAFPSPFAFARHGASGIAISELFPHVAAHADRLCVVRSMRADVPNHEPSLLLMNCGDARQSRPSLGAWLTYGLGTVNQDLPGFVVLCPEGYPICETRNWQAGFLPGIYQGTRIDTAKRDVAQLIEDVASPVASRAEQRAQLDLLGGLDRAYARERAPDQRLDARIQSFELAYRMQMEATDAFDIGREPASIRALYGDDVQGRQMLIARRLIERGVRMVQVWHGKGQPWDSHDDLEQNHRRLAGECDRAIGALLTDLAQRGLLDDTLVVWGGEFGRTPTVELPKPGANSGRINGRDHNHYGFTVWMAGGGAKPGHVHGATDEFGFAAVEDPVHVHDLHATILRLCGFDHERFTYRYAGRDFRLTDVSGRVIDGLIA